MKKQAREQRLSSVHEYEERLINNSEAASPTELETEEENDKHETFGSQMKVLLSNPLFVSLVAGYAARDFMFVGFGFWGIDFAEEYYGTSATVASTSFGVIVFIFGIISVYIGGVILARLLRPYLQ